jgi:hypothetical protein
MREISREGGIMRGIAESMLIGLIALRILPGKMLRRSTESILLALFSLSVLAGRSSRRTKNG